MIDPVHLAWLASAGPGHRLVRHLKTGEIGHVYPDVKKTPPGWEVIGEEPPA